MTDTRFPATYSRLMARELQLDEAGQQALLAGTSLTPETLTRLDVEIAADEQFTIIRNALALSGDPAFGLQWGSHLYTSAHGALGQLITASASVAEGMRAISRYPYLRGRFADVSMSQDEGWLDIHMTSLLPLDEVGLFFMEALLMTTQRSIELILGHRFSEGEILLGYPPPGHAASYARYLLCPYRFSAATTCIRIPLRLADTPNPLSDPEGFREAQRRCELINATIRQRDGWQQRVAALLAAHPGQIWTQQEIAAHLGLSTRTLIRHLKAEGSSYQAILDDTLSRQAKASLALPRHTVEAVALALGYQDVSAFRRAFKRWCGMSPAQYKQQISQS